MGAFLATFWKCLLKVGHFLKYTQEYNKRRKVKEKGVNKVQVENVWETEPETFWIYSEGWSKPYRVGRVLWAHGFLDKVHAAWEKRRSMTRTPRCWGWLSSRKHLQACHRLATSAMPVRSLWLLLGSSSYLWFLELLHLPSLPYVRVRFCFLQRRPWTNSNTESAPINPSVSFYLTDSMLKNVYSHATKNELWEDSCLSIWLNEPIRKTDGPLFSPWSSFQDHKFSWGDTSTPKPDVLIPFI